MTGWYIAPPAKYLSWLGCTNPRCPSIMPTLPQVIPLPAGNFIWTMRRKDGIIRHGLYDENHKLVKEFEQDDLKSVLMEEYRKADR